MDRNHFESEWEDTKELIQNKWNKLTDEDIKYINGRFDHLIDRIQMRYGFTEEQAENAVRQASFEKSSCGAKCSKECDKSSYLKWAIAFCLPLLFAGLWYAGTKRSYDTVAQPNTVVEEVTVIGETDADKPLREVIRQAILARAPLLKDLKALRFSSANGVVTVTGSVATTQERDTIVNLLRNIPGVTQVNDNITVREGS
jgi:uncharacterized protein YjbJ (UPF0337 family)